MTAFYAAWNRDRAVLRESTSGGAFSALAAPVLASGGIVVGAAYGEGLRVEHRVAHDERELARLRGVKYVFSAVGPAVYDEMASSLAAGRRVLFVGTPCQAAAVRTRFGAPPNLLVCDLVCFGAPPQEIWLKYVAWLEKQKGKRLASLSPRDKAKGWGRATYYRYEWEDGSVTRRASLYDPYAQAFYSTLAFRPCCFDCRFRGVERTSDLTLCDMWNAEALNLPKETLRGGVSGVMVHTPAGATAFDAAAVERVRVAEDVFLAGNVPICRSPVRPTNGASFAADAAALPFDQLIRKYGLRRTPLGVALQCVVSVVKRVVAFLLPQRILIALKRRFRHA